MLRCLSVGLALVLTFGSLAARAEEECSSCWTDQCKELSSYLPPCKPKAKKNRSKSRETGTPDGNPPPVVPEVPAGPKVSVEAATARSTALAFVKSGKLDDALTFANQAVNLAPSWGEAILLRGQIFVAQAGPQSELAALTTPDPTVNYEAMVERLKGAIADYEAYAKLDAKGPDHDKAIETLGDLNARLVGAQKDITLAQQLAKQRADEQHAAEIKAQQDAEAAKARAAAEAQRLAEEADQQRRLAQQQAAEAERQRVLNAQHAAEAERARELAVQRKAYDDAVDSAETARHGGYTLVGLGAGLGATALVFNGVGNFYYKELTTQRYATGYQLTQVKTSGDAFRTAAAITGAVAGVLAIAGVPLILANLPPPEQHFALAIEPGRVALVFSGALP